MIHVPQGRYKHYKGEYYSVLHNVKHSETQEEMVVYIGKSGAWVRPTKMFLQKVNDGTGKLVQRFEPIKIKKSKGV